MRRSSRTTIWILAGLLAITGSRATAGPLDALFDPLGIGELRRQVEQGGPVDGERLQRAIAEGGEEGVALARMVFAHQRESLLREGHALLHMPGDMPINSRLLNGLGRTVSQATLDLLEEEFRRPVYVDRPEGAKSLDAAGNPRYRNNPFAEGRRLTDLGRVWGGVYLKMLRRRYGEEEEAYRRAAAELDNPEYDAVDRALLLYGFAMMGRFPNKPRELAFEVYRPYLHSESVEEQRAALAVCSSLWDSGPLEELKRVAYESPDPFNRESAFYLVSRFLAYGSDYPAPSQWVMSRAFRNRSHPGSDREALRRWNAGLEAWRREVTILAFGSAPEPEPVRPLLPPQGEPPALRPDAERSRDTEALPPFYGAGPPGGSRQ